MKNCNTLLGQYCQTISNWREELAGAPYHLKIKEDGDYIMFSYNQIESDFNHPIVREARGIIFKNGQWEHPVCWAFDKFGNYGESYIPEINWETAFVSEKIDGSLIKVWWDGEWHISTNGTIDAFKAEINDVRMDNFGEYFIDTLLKYYNNSTEFYNTLNKGTTYMFELVGPYNRVVVPYAESKIYYLGARVNRTGKQLNCSEKEAKVVLMDKFDLPKQYPLTSLDECIKFTEIFGWQQEGFVVCDAYFNRVKIKSPAYVMAHYVRNNNVITKKHLIEIILKGEIEEFCIYADEYKREIAEIKEEIERFYMIGQKVFESCNTLYNWLPKKIYAEWVKTLPKVYQPYAFVLYERYMDIEHWTEDWRAEKWEKVLAQFKEEMGY